MKYVAVILLITGTSKTFIDHEASRHKFTHVAGTEVIDGYNPGISGDVLVELFKVRNALNALLHGERKSDILVKKYMYNNTPIALTDLITIFEKLEANKVNHDAPDYKAAVECLQAMIENFIKFSDALLVQDSQIIQKMVGKIIHTWAHRSGRHNSFLLQWGTPNEKENFRNISAYDLGQFCIDLKNFLYDLMYSCPKAREQFKNKYITEARYGEKYKQKRTAFDHSFQTTE